MRPVLLLAVLLALLAPRPARSIQGCTLRNPDRDIRKLFPDSTDYRSSFISIADRGGEKLHHKLKERLSDDLDPVYEAMDIPYAYYQVLKGKKTAGYVFGVNQKGRYGGMQIILATDPQGKILHLYYQKLSTPDRKAFHSQVCNQGATQMSAQDRLIELPVCGPEAEVTAMAGWEPRLKFDPVDQNQGFHPPFRVEKIGTRGEQEALDQAIVQSDDLQQRTSIQFQKADMLFWNRQYAEAEAVLREIKQENLDNQQVLSRVNNDLLRLIQAQGKMGEIEL